jgi:hypothetical protein
MMRTMFLLSSKRARTKPSKRKHAAKARDLLGVGSARWEWYFLGENEGHVAASRSR